MGYDVPQTSMDAAVSRFWACVSDHPQRIVPAVISAKSLPKATRLAMTRQDLQVAFRRNRELIDVDGRFRRFTFGGRVWIAKRVPSKLADIERRNATEIRRLLMKDRGTPSIIPIVPVHVLGSCSEDFLVAPDYGTTLHESVDPDKGAITNDFVHMLRSRLGALGIVWRGMVPRNIIRHIPSEKVFLLDMEDVEFHDSPIALDSLTRFVWSLNWIQVGVEASLGGESSNQWPDMPRSNANSVSWPLDSFEDTYRQLVESYAPIEDIRKACAELTLLSEAPLKSKSVVQTPMEIGHFVDDLFPTEISVFYTALTAYYRTHEGEARYEATISDLTTSIAAGLSRAGAATSVCLNQSALMEAVLLGLFQERFLPGSLTAISASIVEWRHLKTETGVNAAVRRSNCLDKLLLSLMHYINLAFPNDGSLQLLLRGSLGQGLMSTRSDVDFELSGPKTMGGCRAMESLLARLLNVFGIVAEGSSGRPTEADLQGRDGLTRELHEWMELRRPGSGNHDPGWLISFFCPNPDRISTQLSIYEANGFPVSGKTLFFQVRSIIARLAFRHCVGAAKTNIQLECLAHRLPEPILRSLHAYLELALEVYESSTASDQAMGELADALHILRTKMGLPLLPVRA
jgi:hypothetical protein